MMDNKIKTYAHNNCGGEIRPWGRCGHICQRCRKIFGDLKAEAEYKEFYTFIENGFIKRVLVEEYKG